MSYLKDFKTQIEKGDFSKFMQLWEEYCTSETVEIEEFVELLKAIKVSEMAKPFGRYIESALPLWKTVQDEEGSYAILSLLIDIQNSNSPDLAELAVNAIKKRYAEDPQFNERMRLVGLRNRDHFQGAIAKYDLLAHIKKGNFVFHHGGWGTGEIIDVSSLREQMMIEFENVRGRKDISFENAFKTLIPLKSDHFLARRFADADQLEKEAKQDPVALIHMLLRDLGPKNAAEIKDELCELVIPEDDWVKWWQNARAKIKKDTMIESPLTTKEPFRLHKAEVTHIERFQRAMQDKTNVHEIIQTIYSYVRDYPDMLKNQEVKNSLKDRLEQLLEKEELLPEQILQLHLMLEQNFNHAKATHSIKQIIEETSNLEEIINCIEIIALKKRALAAVREYRKDWSEQFLGFLFSVAQVSLRDYILKELSSPETFDRLESRLRDLLQHPEINPEAFIWYFQKVVNKEDVPFSNKEGQCLFFESFLVLFSMIENKPIYRDLLKKMYQLLSGKRYEVVRSIIEDTNLTFINEFLLLASKCQTLSDHDMKILRSLAEVVQPSLVNKKNVTSHDMHIIWTTEEGYFKTQDRIRHVGTIEIVENAREIEAARALGDLRENSEYKFALEKRSRLQAELKMMSDQFNRARIITKDDVSLEEVGIGSIVEVIDSQGKKTTYTILGPWDADPEKNILSFQSKFAQAMVGRKEEEKFQFRNEDFTISKLKSFFGK